MLGGAETEGEGELWDWRKSHLKLRLMQLWQDGWCSSHWGGVRCSFSLLAWGPWDSYALFVYTYTYGWTDIP